MNTFFDAYVAYLLILLVRLQIVPDPAPHFTSPRGGQVAAADVEQR